VFAHGRRALAFIYTRFAESGGDVTVYRSDAIALCKSSFPPVIRTILNGSLNLDFATLIRTWIFLARSASMPCES
jgi:hypothetical protein